MSTERNQQSRKSVTSSKRELIRDKYNAEKKFLQDSRRIESARLRLEAQILDERENLEMEMLAAQERRDKEIARLVKAEVMINRCCTLFFLTTIL